MKGVSFGHEFVPKLCLELHGAARQKRFRAATAGNLTAARLRYRTRGLPENVDKAKSALPRRGLKVRLLTGRTIGTLVKTTRKGECLEQAFGFQA